MELKVIVPMRMSDIRFKKKLDRMLHVYGLTLDDLHNMKNLINGMNELIKQDEKEIQELKNQLEALTMKPIDNKKADPSYDMRRIYLEMTGDETPKYTGGE